MNDDYLWQRAGDDPEIRALEQQLAGLAHGGEPLPDLPERTDARRTWRALGLAAAVLLVGATAWMSLGTGEKPGREPVGGWALRGQVGGTRCDGAVASGVCGLAVGEFIEAEARLDLAVADIGTLALEPDTRLGLVASGAAGHRLKLERGTIHARVLAPPRLLVVETPGATAVDLGCSYTLSVDAAGAGFLAVETGAVALEHAELSVHVPAGARTETRPGAAPGVPYFTDAEPALQQALERLSFETGVSEVVEVALAAARPRDSLSLWHLLPRVGPEQRKLVVRRIAELVELDRAALPEAALVELEPAALEQLRRELEPSWG
ncbi:FecR domain-containing protein [Nannocystis sp. SCPEA4]|uniref:FecR domain-containing protein n=1 Tax=Nannocystis sp. SCPEA4 TaxID=2996787 RepID=UPI00226E0506|nr:FecR domain-containing protein [Nannocystis sp. SCPEA4]MCY1056639.1 hypothetical protein [Nannocystis sp. SCPEA4]